MRLACADPPGPPARPRQAEIASPVVGDATVLGVVSRTPGTEPDFRATFGWLCRLWAPLPDRVMASSLFGRKSRGYIEFSTSPFPTISPPFMPESDRPAPRLGRLPNRSRRVMVGTNVRAFRLAAGLSGGQLATRAGISRSMLSRTERGLVCPSVDTLDVIACALCIRMSILFEEPPMPGAQGHRVI